MHFVACVSRRICLPGILVLSAFVVGCGSGLCNVEGNVVWKDGTPAKELENAQVIFDLPAKKTGSRGSIQADGTFKLTTNKPDDGTLAGDYKVMIVEIGRKPLGSGPDPTEMAPGVMDSKYSDPSSTDLKVTIKPGLNKVTLTVDRAKKR